MLATFNRAPEFELEGSQNLRCVGRSTDTYDFEGENCFFYPNFEYMTVAS
jgi:hypothetical protein